MPETSLVNLPSAPQIITAVGSSSGPIFNELLPIGLLVTGFIVGGLIVALIITSIPSAFAWFTHRNHDKFD